MLVRPPVGDGAVPPKGWRITNPFGNYYMLQPGVFAYHTGIDTVISEGSSAFQPIYAVADGRVTFARRVPNSTWGNVLVIQHTEPDGMHFYSRYGHDNDFLVNEGDRVVVGQMIAHVGNAFGVFPYHLHFDISLTETLLTHPADWPGLNLELLRQTYVDPIAFLKGQTMISWQDQAKVLLNQVAALIDTNVPAGQPPSTTPPAGTTPVTTKNDGTNVRSAPAIPASGQPSNVLAVLSAGTVLNVKVALNNAGQPVNANGHLWYAIINNDGTIRGYVAQDVTSPN